MAKYTPPPHPPFQRRALAWLQTPLGATIVGGFIVLVGGYLIFGQSGGGANNSTQAQSVAKGGEAPREAEPEPKSPVEKAAERPFWVALPETFKGAERYEPYVAAIDYGRIDLLVGSLKEIYENPEEFQDETFYIVGRVASQTPLPGPFYRRELRLIAGESGFDAYIGATDYATEVADGEIVLARGRLAAEGETEQPNGDIFRSIYFLATAEGNGGEVESRILEPTSGTLRAAIKRVRKATDTHSVHP